jgi:hypothetical protein
MNVIICWDVAPCGPYAVPHFGGTYHLHLQGRISAEQGTSMHQVARHIQTTRRCIPEDDNFHNYSCEDLYTVFSCAPGPLQTYSYPIWRNLAVIGRPAWKGQLWKFFMCLLCSLVPTSWSSVLISGPSDRETLLRMRVDSSFIREIDFNVRTSGSIL